MISNLRISTKFTIIIALSAFGVAAVALTGLSALKSNILENRRVALRDEVLLARQVIELDYQASKQAGASDEEAMARSKIVLKALRVGKDNDYFFAADGSGVLRVHPSVEGKNLIDAKDSHGVSYLRDMINGAKRGGEFVAFEFPRLGNDVPVPKTGYALEFKPYGWVIGSTIYIDDVEATFRAQLIRIGTLICLVFIAVIALGWLLRRSIVKPMGDITIAMRKLARGKADTDIPALGRRDEIGAIANTIQVFKETMIETERLRHQQDGMKKQAETERADLLMKMTDAFEYDVQGFLDRLAQSAVEMRQTSEHMLTTANHASACAARVTTVAGQATTSVQSVAAATEQLSSSVSEIGRQVVQSTDTAAQAVQKADRTNLTVHGLATAAQKIGDVVSLINDIASQTNLLALNATIEAARAGDAGKGFAVVANEVKTLASQTAKATDEITVQVSAMRDATDEAVSAIHSIGETIGSINEITTTIASAVEEQGVATREIARNVMQAAQGTDEMSTDIVEVRDATGKTGIAAKQVLVTAEQVSQQSAALFDGVGKFLAKIRAA
jgi:methyl-accepting chemotaxis protein